MALEPGKLESLQQNNDWREKDGKRWILDERYLEQEKSTWFQKI